MRYLFAVALLLVAHLATAATITIEWEHPTACSDGSSLTNCPATGYEVYQGVTPTGTAYQLQATVPATDKSATITGVTPGQRCYFVRTVAGEARSAESARACVTVPAPPSAPSNITVTVSVTVN